MEFHVLAAVLTLVFILGSCSGETYCVYSKQAVVKYSKQDHTPEDEDDAGSIPGNLLDSNTTELCPSGSNYCYTLWQEEAGTNKTDGSKTVILAQGCWDSSNEVDCSVDSCTAKKRPPKAMNNTKFCCCLGYMCNANVTDAYIPSGEDIPESQPALQYVEQASYQTEVVVIVLAIICSFIIVLTAGFLTFRMFSSSRKPSLDSMHMMESSPPPLPKFDLDSLKLQEVVGRGRFGSVSKGTLNDQTVAVKVFVMQNRQYFLNERDIYSQPHMDHPCIPKYIGSDERLSPDGRPEYLLVLSYAPLGCMQDFLRHNVVDWPTLCKMAQTITQGLAYLHTEFKKGDKMKPCIAHRDLNSRNILVKSDGSCELCDYGFAIRMSCSSKYYQNGEEQVAETTSLAEVGTLRYMAPEVLEGAVNLRDCESSLKQIDVYALGLVMWEIGTRCTDLYQGVEVPDYRLPFEMEIGLHPTMEQMQVLVTRNKARPLFPDIWKASNPAVRLYKETIEDCWDQDAEARLSALCVEERLLELPILWERYKAGNTVSGVSPTVNLTSSHPRPTILGNLLNTNQQIQTLLTFDNSDKNVPEYRSDADQTVGSVSENTVDTLLTTSPSEPASSPANPHNYKNKNNYSIITPFQTRFTVPLQPHQGRNPCMERNLMEPDQEVSIRGNTLLGKGSGVKNMDFPYLRNDDVFDVLHFPESIESNVLMTNDALNQGSRVCNPIPYVQNAVHSAGAMPKQPNLPGNGRHTHTEGKNDKKKTFPFFDRKKSNKDRGFKQGLKNLLERRKTSKNPTGGAEDQQLLQSSPISDKINSPMQEGTMYCQADQFKSNLYGPDWYEKLSPVVTQVCVVGGDRNNATREMVVSPIMNGHLPGYAPEDFYYKNDSMILDGTRDINDNCNSNGHLGLKFARPDSLAVQGHGIMQQEGAAGSSNVQCNSVQQDQSEKIVRRVKTPYEVKPGRFSLCDDRVMSEEDAVYSDERRAVTVPFQQSTSAKISLSLPMDMNALCGSDSEDRSSNFGPTQI